LFTLHQTNHKHFLFLWDEDHTFSLLLINLQFTLLIVFVFWSQFSSRTRERYVSHKKGWQKDNILLWFCLEQVKLGLKIYWCFKSDPIITSFTKIIFCDIKFVSINVHLSHVHICKNKDWIVPLAQTGGRQSCNTEAKSTHTHTRQRVNTSRISAELCKDDKFPKTFSGDGLRCAGEAANKKIKNFTFFAITGNKVPAYQEPLYVALPLVFT
jgi:hypothetical protein